MTLLLRITSQHSQFLGDDASERLPDGGSIGRSKDNDLVLVDPQRIISGRHARIERRPDGYYLIDISTNGTWLNEQQLTQNVPVELADGDQLRIGEYELLIEIDATEAAAVGASSTAPLFGDSTPPPGSVNPVPGSLLEPSVTGTNTSTGTSSTATPPPSSAPLGDSGSLDPLSLLGAEGPNTAVPDSEPPANPLPPTAPAGEHFEPPQMQATPPANPAAIPDDWLNDDSDDLFGDPSSDQGSFSANKVEAPAQPQADETPATPRPPAPGAASVDSGIQSLLQSAGLDPQQIDPATVANLGTVLTIAVQGLIEVLRARGQIKNQFRVPVTMVQPRDNNPLKVAVTAQDALQMLFTRSPSDGFQDPVTAFSEGFGDIKNHQIAMLVGMQNAFSQLLKRLHPDQLEARFERSAKPSRLLDVVGKSRYWDQYREFFEDLGDEEVAFQELFGEAFAAAYEDTMQKLERER